MYLEIRKMNKIYHSGKVPFQALTDVSLDIEKGSFMALCGPSGSGKTTLLNIIGCIDNADSGTMVLDGADISGKTPDEYAFLRRDYFGFIFQTSNLIPVLTVFENVELPLRLLGKSKTETTNKVMDVLDKVGLTGLESRKPLELSGGQQQRVSIARALVKDPKVILADEPTANLDSVNGESIVALMQEMNRSLGATFIFSTHDPMVMKHAQRIVNLKDGRVQAS